MASKNAISPAVATNDGISSATGINKPGYSPLTGTKSRNLQTKTDVNVGLAEKQSSRSKRRSAAGSTTDSDREFFVNRMAAKRPASGKYQNGPPLTSMLGLQAAVREQQLDLGVDLSANSPDGPEFYGIGPKFAQAQDKSRIPPHQHLRPLPIRPASKATFQPVAIDHRQALQGDYSYPQGAFRVPVCPQFIPQTVSPPLPGAVWSKTSSQSTQSGDSGYGSIAGSSASTDGSPRESGGRAPNGLQPVQKPPRIYPTSYLPRYTSVHNDRHIAGAMDHNSRGMRQTSLLSPHPYSLTGGLRLPDPGSGRQATLDAQSRPWLTRRDNGDSMQVNRSLYPRHEVDMIPSTALHASNHPRHRGTIQYESPEPSTLFRRHHDTTLTRRIYRPGNSQVNPQYDANITSTGPAVPTPYDRFPPSPRTQLVPNELRRDLLDTDVRHFKMTQAQRAPPSEGSDVNETSSASSFETNSSESLSLLLDDHSTDLQPLEDTHPFMKVREIALHILFQKFQDWRNHIAKPSAPNTGTSQTSSNDNEPSKKRQRGGKDHDTNDNDDEHSNSCGKDSQGNLVATRKRRRTKDVKATFACPFWKKDSSRYQGCCTFVLTRIRDVKQHLGRKHVIPIYCPQCMGTFDDEVSRDIHVRERTCSSRPWTQHDGITEAQKQLLSKKAPPNLSQEDQWYTIFDILFPNHEPRPKTPYIDHNLIQPITLYQTFVTHHGPGILSAILTLRGAVTWNLPNEERDLAAFQQRILEDGLRNIFDQFVNQNGHPTTDSLATSGLETVNSTSSTNSIARRTPSSGPSVQEQSLGSLDNGANEALQDWQELPAPSRIPGVDGEFSNFWGAEDDLVDYDLTTLTSENMADINRSLFPDGIQDNEITSFTDTSFS